MTALILTDQDLLHGAIYALDQAGRHLHCGVNLWNAGDYAHGLMIAVFAREEVGRFKLLRDEREAAKIHGPRNAVDIKKVLQHKAKLKAGAPMLGAYRSRRGGHRLNALVLKAMFADADAWTMIEAPRYREVRHAELSHRLAAANFAPERS